MVVKLSSGIECVHSGDGRVHCTLYSNGGNDNALDSLSDVYRPIYKPGVISLELI